MQAQHWHQCSACCLRAFCNCPTQRSKRSLEHIAAYAAEQPVDETFLESLCLQAETATWSDSGGLPCRLWCALTCRPALVSHIATSKQLVSTLGQLWLVKLGVKLPEHIAYVVHIRLVDDCDAPTVPYPDCCVLAPGGWSYTPHKAGSRGHLVAMQKLTGSSQLCIGIAP